MKLVHAKEIYRRARIVDRVRENPCDRLAAGAWRYEVRRAYSYSHVLRAVYTCYSSPMKSNTKWKKQQATKNVCSIVSTIYYRHMQLLVRCVSSEVRVRSHKHGTRITHYIINLTSAMHMHVT